MLPWRRPQPHSDDASETLRAFRDVQESREARELARRLAARLREEREKNHLEELFRRALGGKP